MPSLFIPDVENSTLSRLTERAVAHGRSPEAEAKVLLEQVLHSPPAVGWDQVNAFRERLAASGRRFGDSADLIREDRER
jgi:plasmid stability protein